MKTLDLSWDDEDGGFYFDDMNELIERIAEVKDTVKKLKITGQHELTEIPAIIGECKLLEELNISNNSIKEIPAIIGECKLLEKLDISINSIKEIPDFVFTLPALRSLYCQYNDIIDLPAAIAKAVKLETLQITVNNDKSIPEEIGALTKLKNLNLLMGEYFTLPEILGNLPCLEEFSLWIHNSDAGAIALPASFANHPALRKITIGKAALDFDSTARILVSCPNLESLVLNRIHARMGNNGFALPVQLKELELWDCTFDGNPYKAIGYLHKLRMLKIFRGYNYQNDTVFEMDELPDIFGNLSLLQEFYCNCYAQKLPLSIYSLSKLERLTLNCTAITELDEKIGNLQNLKQLMVGYNMLETLPEQVFSMPNLVELEISGNNFSRKEVTAIKNKIKVIPGRKIKLTSGGQGPSETKKFEIMQHNAALQNIAPLHDVKPYSTITDPYYAQYLAAINEGLHALSLVDKRIRSFAYYEICMAAVKKDAYAISRIDIERLDDFIRHYSTMCLIAAKGEGTKRMGLDTKTLLKIRDDLLSYEDYIRFCFEVVTHNRYAGILEGIKYERLEREDYLRICWVSILQHSGTVCCVVDPPPDLCMFALKLNAHLSDIPIQARSYEICTYAIKNDRFILGLEDIPEQHRDDNMLSLLEQAKAKREEKTKKIFEQTDVEGWTEEPPF